MKITVTGLHLRPQKNGQPVYYCKVHVPKALWSVVGKKCVWKSLQTGSLEEAARLLPAVRATVLKALTQPRLVDPAQVARAYEREELRETDIARMTDEEREGLGYALTEAFERLHDDPKEISALLSRVLKRQKVAIVPEDRSLYEAELLRSEIRVLRALLARTQGKANAGKEVTGQTVTELLEVYLREVKPIAKTQIEVRAAFRKFVNAIGGDRTASTITQEDVRKFRASLFAEGQSPATTKKGLTLVAAAFRSAGIEAPFQGKVMFVKRTTTQHERRMGYSPAQVSYLLDASANLLTGARRWLVWLGAFTGARLEELAGLAVSDVKTEGTNGSAVTYLHIRPRQDRRLKNLGSERKVPVAPALVAAGFLDHVKAQPKEGLVFPDLLRAGGKLGPHGKLGGAFGLYFGRWTAKLAAAPDASEEVKGLADRRLVYHSLRHSYKTAAREAGIAEQISDYLTGHAPSSVGRGYGSAPSLKVLAEAVAKINFEEEA